MILSTDKIIPTLHLLSEETLPKAQLAKFKMVEVISYYSKIKDYLINVCLTEIKKNMDNHFRTLQKLTLD